MVLRIVLAAAVFVAVALVIWHPPRSPVVQSIVASSAPPVPGPAAHRLRHRPDAYAGADEMIVYVAGAVRRPGLYHLRLGDRAERAVELAGGLLSTAASGGVNLAQRAADGDEIYVPAAGETHRVRPTLGRGRRHARTPPQASVDLNRAEAGQLAGIPGIGHAIAQRIVELRAREGSFTSLDQLLDVAGMTQTRLDRARPYLRDP